MILIINYHDFHSKTHRFCRIIPAMQILWFISIPNHSFHKLTTAVFLVHLELVSFSAWTMVATISVDTSMLATSVLFIGAFVVVWIYEKDRNIEHYASGHRWICLFSSSLLFASLDTSFGPPFDLSGNMFLQSIIHGNRLLILFRTNFFAKRIIWRPTFIADLITYSFCKWELLPSRVRLCEYIWNSSICVEQIHWISAHHGEITPYPEITTVCPDESW